MPAPKRTHIRCKYCGLVVERDDADGLFAKIKTTVNGVVVYGNYCHRCGHGGKNQERVYGEAIYPLAPVYYRLVNGLPVSNPEMRQWKQENPIARYPVPSRKWHNRKAYYRHRDMYIAKAKARTAARTTEESAYWTNKRRVRKKNAPGSHTQEEWERLLAKCGGKCLCCGSTENITRDHIVPLSLGGTDDIDNLQPLCHSCNSAKQAKAINYRP